MRRDELEIGLEREYAIYASSGGTLSYLLAAERLLALLDVDLPGWRIAPEYAHCLVEIASPPVTRDGWPALLAGFAQLEAGLARAAERLAARSRFDDIACTAAFSVRTDRYVAWDGTRVTRFPDLLLDPAADNWLLGDPAAAPACLAQPHLAYAGFTSTNATLHPPLHGPLADAPLAAYYWTLLRTGRAIDTATPQRHAILRDGLVPVAPDPERSIRDALIRWGDPETAALLDALPTGAYVERFHDLFGQPATAAFDPGGFHAYSCRPRVVEDTMLFELRCFHAGLPLARLAPLLDVSLRGT